MKVLISGGLKTQNIVDGLEKKFASGGIQFIIVPYIEDIEAIFARGEYYDRALIIEPSWTEEYTDKDTHSIRTRVNNFAQMAERRGTKGLNYVFLSQTEEMADLVYEEILLIEPVSINVVKAPKYSVNFFAGLVSMSFEQFPDSIVYKPKIEIPENTEDIQVTEFEDDENNYESVEIDDISSDLFTDDISHAPGLNDYLNGVDVVIEHTHTEEVPEEQEEIPEDNFESLFDELGNIEVTEDETDNKIEEDLTRESGNIPDFNYEATDNDNYEDILATIQSSQTDEYEDFDDIPIEEDIQVKEDIQTDYSRESGDIPTFESEDDNYSKSLYETTPRESGDIPTFDNKEYENTQEYDRFTIGVNTHDNSTEEDNVFDESYYTSTEDTIEDTREDTKLDISDIGYVKNILDAFANRGNSIVVTGCGGCGTSTVAYNLANTVCSLGYTVLLVDMDTENRAQSFISKSNYDCVELDGANLKQALKSSTGINTYVSIVKPGFRLLTMGLGGDIVPLDKMIEPQKLARFINSAKTNHNFVIYDLPFKDAVGCAGDVTFMSDNLVIVSDCSNWGTTKTLSSIGNIENEDLQDIFYSKGQLMFNRVNNNTKKILGRRVKSITDVPRCMDMKIADLLGEEPLYRFSDMHLCGSLGYIDGIEDCWYNTKQYSDTQEGFNLFTELLIKIVLKN